MMAYNGLASWLTLILQMLFILMTFRGLQSFHLERMFRQTPPGLPLLTVLISVAVGSACGSFFAEFFIVLQGSLSQGH